MNAAVALRVFTGSALAVMSYATIRLSKRVSSIGLKLGW